MAIVYAGSTPIYHTKLFDKDGTQLDPSDVSNVVEVKIFIYNAITGAVIGKFYLNTLPPGEGWTKLPAPKTFGDGDVRIMLILSAAQTIAAEGNSNEIQMNVHVVDGDAPSGVRIIIKKGKFTEIKPSKS
jgi:hypothetical protein